MKSWFCTALDICRKQKCHKLSQATQFALKPSQCCRFIEVNIGTGVDAGEEGKSGGGNSKGGAPRDKCGETVGMGEK